MAAGYLRRTATVIICTVMISAVHMNSYALIDTNAGPALEKGSYIATIDVEKVNINKSTESTEVLMEASLGDVFQVIEDMGDGWVKVNVGDTYGYLPASENATITETDSVEEAVASTTENIDAQKEAAQRQALVDYALQFVGGRYRFGGSDPHTGVDCSGFTKYVMQNGAGISLARSSTEQSFQGTRVSSENMQPGDLIFYGSGGGINHVAMYIGNGQIVHASTERTGIKVSSWNYRTPVRIMSYFS